MLNKKIQDAFNRQINAELSSAYLYLSMDSWLQSRGLKGMAHWMGLQAREETMHTMKFIDFINECDGRVLLAGVEGPKTEWDSALAVFEDTCKHEARVTGLIHELVDLAAREKDHAAGIFLQWFVTEQVEEEAAAKDIRDKLRLAGDNGAVLFMIDQELGRRPGPAAQS